MHHFSLAFCFNTVVWLIDIARIWLYFSSKLRATKLSEISNLS